MTTHERVQRAPVADASGRRDFLRKAGVAGAAAWVAPVVLSTPAVAQGTPVPCTPTTLNWHTAVGQNNLGSAAGPIPVGSTTMTITASTTSPVAVYHDRITPTLPGAGPGAPQGGLPRYYCLGLGGAGGGTNYPQYTAGVASQARFTFATPVEDLRFTIVDIDRGGTNNLNQPTNYHDIVQINWAPTTTTMTGTRLGTNPTFEGSNPYQSINPPGAATGNAPADSPDGNLRVEFDGPIEWFEVVYTAGPISGPFTTQIIGISDLELCA